MDYDTYMEENMQHEQLIEHIYEALLSNEDIDAVALATLRNVHEQRISSSSQIRAHLVYCRYLLQYEQVEEAAAILQTFNDTMLPAASREWQLFVAVTAYYELMRGQYELILQRERETNSIAHMASASSFEQANYMYHLAFASHRAYEFSLAKHYMEQAIQRFTHRYKPLFQVKLHSMYGVIYNALGDVDAALKEYAAAIDILQHVPAIATPAQWASIYNNMAFAYESNEQFIEAITYYDKALQHQQDVHTQTNYTRALLFGRQEALFLQQLEALARYTLTEGTHQHMQYVLMRAYVERDHIATFSKVEKRVFTYFTEAGHIELILSYGPLVAAVHEAANQYKRATELYRLLFNTSERMRQRVAARHRL